MTAHMHNPGHAGTAAQRLAVDPSPNVGLRQPRSGHDQRVRSAAPRPPTRPNTAAETALRTPVPDEPTTAAPLLPCRRSRDSLRRHDDLA